MLKLILWALDWLRGKLGRAVQQQAADTAAIQYNEDAEHAVQRVEARPPVPPSAVSSRMRDGSF